MGAQVVREAASKTNEVVGDGSTTATILAEAIFREGMKCVAAGADPVALKRGIEHGVEIVILGLKKQSKRAAGAMLRQVGTVSANGDRLAGGIVAQALEKIGKDGFIALEDSNSIETRLELVQGMQLDRGYLSRHFVTDKEQMVARIDNPYVLIFEEKISSAQALVPILEQVANTKRPLLIVCEDVEGEALATLIVNNERGHIKVCAVKAPEFGDYRLSLLQDLAAFTGGRAITEQLGTPLERVRIGDLGSARRVLISQEKTRIVEGGGEFKLVESRAIQVREQLERASSSGEREQLQRRLAKLSGWAGVIKVGAPTEAEMKEKRGRIVSAIHAARAAMEEGIVPGGGVALLRSTAGLRSVKLEGDAQIGVGIVRKICQEPIRHLVRNAGHEAGPVVERVLSATVGTRGFNAASGNWEDLVKSGVIDATKVTRNALENASLAASAMLLTEAAIAESEEGKEETAAHEKASGSYAAGEASRPFYETNLRARAAAEPLKVKEAVVGELATGGGEQPPSGGGEPPKPPQPPDEPGRDGEEPQEPVEITLYPVIEAKPEHVVANQLFQVDVSLQWKPPDTKVTEGEVNVPPGEHTLWVHLLFGAFSLWDELRWSSSRGMLKKANFVVIAPSIEPNKNGEVRDRQYRTLTCNFYLNGRWCGEALRNIEILLNETISPSAGLGSPPKVKWRDLLSLGLGAEPPDLLVRIQEADTESYEWTLLSPHLDLRPTNYDPQERTILKGGPQRFVKKHFDQVAGKEVDDKLRPRIEQRCREIYKSSSDSFKDAYWRLYHGEKAAAESGTQRGLPIRLKSIQFISDEPYIPWELMLVRDDKRGKGVKEEILSIRHAVGRWVRDASGPLRQRINVRSMKVFASNYNDVKGVEPKLPWAIEERDLLVRDYSASPGILKFDPVRDFFRNGRAQAVHFSCHGKMNPDLPTESSLWLEDYEDFVTAFLEDDAVREGEGNEHPLIFLNACQLAAAGPNLALVSGWPQTFLSAGASACVAPLWSVVDEKAREASVEFYRLVFDERKSLGEALQEVRRTWVQKRSLTFLSYVLYGDPLARVFWQRPLKGSSASEPERGPAEEPP
jgi:chaperonin GroEL